MTFQIELKIETNNENKSPISRYIDAHITAIHNENRGFSFREVLSEHIKTERIKKELLEILSEPHKETFVYDSILDDSIELKVNDLITGAGTIANKARHFWDFTCKLRSITYTLINITNDSTFICYTDDKEIQFIKLSDNQRAIVIED